MSNHNSQTPMSRKTGLNEVVTFTWEYSWVVSASDHRRFRLSPFILHEITKFSLPEKSGIKNDIRFEKFVARGSRELERARTS